MSMSLGVLFLLMETRPSCNGKGKSKPVGSDCKSCRGRGVVRDKKSLQVDVPAGIDDGMRVRLARQGDAPLEGTGIPGDVLIQVGTLFVHLGRSPSSIY